MKHNNGGYTLVELIVVIAIMGVLATMAVLSLSLISSTGARKCANQVDAALTACKVNCMSRAEAKYLRIYTDETGTVHGEYLEGTTPRDDVLSSRKVTVTYAFGGGEETELTATDNLYVAFDRATGGLKNFTDAATGSVLGSTERGVIRISGGLQTYTITVDALTGAHTLKG